MSENVAIVDEHGTITLVNKAWEAFSAHNSGISENTSQGVNYFDSINTAAQNGDEFAKRVKSGIEDILSNKLASFELEYPCHSESENRWFIANIREIHNYTPRLFLFTHKDVSSLVERESKVLQAQRLEAVGQLTGGIAHDFNNLLGIILGNTELAQQNVSDKNQLNQYLTNSITAIERGSSLIQKLLSFSRQQDLTIESLDVNTFIQSTFNLIRPVLGEDINIVTELDDTPLTVEVDSSMLSSAILNIAINSRHAMPTGGILQIRTSREKFNGELFFSSEEKVYGSYALIAISDTGNGISEENISKVFEPFFTTKAIGHGSGLGLSMVFGFMKQSKGYINITSRLDKGTTIFLYLPIRSMQKHDNDITTKADPLTPDNTTILLVEDNKDFLNTYTEMLKGLGYNVFQCEDGQKALDILKIHSRQIDIVLSDVVMPTDIGGIDLAKTINLKYPEIKVLLMTGYPRNSFKNHNTDTLPVLLNKPFTLKQLTEAIKSL